MSHIQVSRPPARDTVHWALSDIEMTSDGDITMYIDQIVKW